MNRLTEEQKMIVEQNHNLIYGVANKFHLNVDDWYGLLAIELCKAVMHHDPERGKLSTYYYIRAGSTIINEMSKAKTQKRQHEGTVDMEYLDDVESNTQMDNYDVLIGSLEEWFSDEEYGDILKYKLQGYTQKDIAKKLDLKPYAIKAKLKKAKEFYNETYRNIDGGNND